MVRDDLRLGVGKRWELVAQCPRDRFGILALVGLGDPRWVKGTVRLSFLDRWSWQASFWSSVETGANRKRVPNLKPTICRSGKLAESRLSLCPIGLLIAAGG